MRIIARQPLILSVMSLCFFGSAKADDRGFLTLGGGAYEVAKSSNRVPGFYAAYRFAPRLFEDRFGSVFHGIGPMLGVLGNTDGSVYGYGDLFIDIRPTENLVIWPSAGIGGYRQGSGQDLGGIFQFHAELFVGYSISKRQMLGISLQHISNADTHDINPTSNSLFATYTITLSPFF